MPWEYVFRLGLVACFALLVERSARGHARETLLVFWLPLTFGAAVSLLHWIWTGQLDVFPFAFALVFSLTQTAGDFSPSVPAVLSHRFAPVLIGVLTALTTLAVWGTLDAIPIVHDEAAYLLQSRIFLTGRWTAPARPVPEFFEQVHVFVTPVLASKYPPGHSMALVPGVALGLPGLMPIALSGVSGGFLFLLARRYYGGSVALIAWVVWLTAPGLLMTRASYLSESTSSALWLLGWWSLIRWRESGEPGRLWLLALTSGALCLTRPLTMLAFVIPVGVVVLYEVARRKVWKDFAISIAVGALILIVIPLWSTRTLGTWRTTPYQYYSAVYFPYETVGFGLRDTPALRPHPSALEPADRLFRGIHRRHQIRDLPTIFGDRLAAIARDIWGPGRLRHLQAIFALLGALTAGPPMGFALAASTTLIVAYLSYAHSPAWIPYYSAVFPVLAVLTSLGLWRFTLAVARRLQVAGPAGPRSGLVLALAMLPLLPTFLQLGAVRTELREKSVDKREFRAAVSRIPEEKAIVFVRYSAGHDPHRELISNEPDLNASRVWIVYDRGEENPRLLEVAPERTPYVYVEARRALERLAPTERGKEYEREKRGQSK